MLNIPMQWSIFHLCLVLGLFFSASFFGVKEPHREYTLIHRVVFYVLLGTLVSEIIWEAYQYSPKDSIILYNLLFTYLRITLMLILIYCLPYSCQIQNKVMLSLWLFLGFGVVNSIWMQNITTSIQSYSQMLGNGIILLFALIFFKDIIRQNKFRDKNLLSLPYFWIATFMLFSFGETFIFYLFSTLFFPVQLTNLGFIQMFVKFFAGLMFLVFGIAFYIPLVFEKQLKEQ
nr:hypothetical protein [Cytophagales bacterium]